MRTILNPLRIAINHTRFSLAGGIERHVYRLVEHLLSRGHEVHCFVRRWEPYPHPRLHFHAVPVLPFGEGVKALSFAYASAFLLRRQRFDIIHGFTKTFRQDVYTDGAGSLDDYLAALRGWRGPLKLRPLANLALRHLERRRFQARPAPRVLAMSRLARGQILARYRLPERAVEVLYGGVDAEEFRPATGSTEREAVRCALETPPEAVTVLFAGSDYQRKGLDIAIEALSRLRRPDVVLWVLGRDRRRAAYERLARQKGIEARFAGLERRPQEFFRAADVFVFPSRYDIFGNAGLEAMASGLAAVISASAGVSEIVRDGVDSLILREPEDAGELTSHLETLLDPETRRRLGKNARETALRHRLEAHFERVVEVYREVVDGPAGVA